MNCKADASSVTDLEKLIMTRLNDIVTALSSKFADKIDTKKGHKLLERQMKNLYDMVTQKGDGVKDDEVMFGRKHLCGYACACCEKDLVNMQGKKVEYNVWGRMPARDPNERIARVGQGFSKILSTMNPETLGSQRGSLGTTQHDSIRNNT